MRKSGAVFATVLALFIQASYQKYTSEFRAAIIFTTEPIFATLFAYFFFNEAISIHIFMGGMVIIASVLLAEFFRSDQ